MQVLDCTEQKSNGRHGFLKVGGIDDCGITIFYKFLPMV